MGEGAARHEANPCSGRNATNRSADFSDDLVGDFSLHREIFPAERVRIARCKYVPNEFLAGYLHPCFLFKTLQMKVAETAVVDRRMVKGSNVVFNPHYIRLQFGIAFPDLNHVVLPDG